jgi:hypothetical protein
MDDANLPRTHIWLERNSRQFKTLNARRNIKVREAKRRESSFGGGGGNRRGGGDNRGDGGGGRW